MRILNVLVVKDGSVVRVCLVLAFGALMGSVCWAQRVERPANKHVAHLLNSCFEGCDGPACLRECIADNEIPLGSYIPVSGTSGPSVVSGCFDEASDNLTLCGRTFLVPYENADLEAFWVCAGAATERFAICPAFDASFNPETTAKFGNLILEWLVDTAEYTVAHARAGDLEGMSPSSALSNGEEVELGRPSALEQTAPEPEPKTFQECLDAFVKNVTACTAAFPEDPDALKRCRDVAEAQFRKCLGLKKLIQP